MIGKEWELTLAERAEISIRQKEFMLEAVAIAAQRKLMMHLNMLYPNKTRGWKQICRNLGIKNR